MCCSHTAQGISFKCVLRVSSILSRKPLFYALPSECFLPSTPCTEQDSQNALCGASLSCLCRCFLPALYSLVWETAIVHETINFFQFQPKQTGTQSVSVVFRFVSWNHNFFFRFVSVFRTSIETTKTIWIFLLFSPLCFPCFQLVECVALSGFQQWRKKL